MGYSKFMAEIIKNSGYSLRKLGMICETKYNVKITASYLSKLQTGGQTPASNDVNVAIAKACGIDPEDLLFEASLERAPEDVKKLVDMMIMQIKGLYIELGKNESIREADTENDLDRFINMGTRQFLKAIIEEDKKIVNPLETNFKVEDAGELFAKLSIGLKMLDESMFPIIRQDAKIELDNTQTIKDGDIVSANLPNGKKVIRTYIKKGKDIILIPANKNFEIITINEKDITINGRVKSITIDL